MWRLFYAVALLGSFWCFGAGRADGGIIATFSLGTPSVNGSTASIPLYLALAGGPGDQVEAFQLNVAASDSDLTSLGMDFIRFTFVLDPVALTGWTELVAISSGTNGVGLYAPDPLLGPFLPVAPTPYALGTLQVDITGLPPATEYVIALTGGTVGLLTDASGTVNGNPVDSFTSADPATAIVTFANGGAARFSTASDPAAVNVPEPGSLALLGLALLCLRRIVRSSSLTEAVPSPAA